MPSDVRLRGVYGKPIAKRAGQSIPLTRKQLEFVGETILKAIRREIARDTAKAGSLRQRGEPVPIPKTKRFAKSFRFRIRGESTLEFYSDWPTAESHTSKDPSKPFPMTWLRQPKTPLARIVRSGGEVVVRTTPGIGDKMWVHPGFKRYTFLERGVRKGRDEAAEALLPEVIEDLLSSHDLFGG